MIALGIALGVVVVLAIAAASLYNRLVRLRNRVKNAFSQIDVQLTRRYDLIPNLVETAKGYLAHERQTLEAVVAARGAALTELRAASADPTDPGAVQQLAAAEQQLGGALGRLLALREAYPDLKANQTMMQLSEELTTTENRVAFARQAYNDSVMAYNNATETFPSAILAAPFGFRAAGFFEVENEDARAAPKVSF